MKIPSLSVILVSAIVAASPGLAQTAADPAAPAKSQASLSNAGPAPGSMAHFRFDGTAQDENLGNPPFMLANTEFRDNALYLNGKYENDGSNEGYRAVCRTQTLDYNKFTVALRFKAETFGEKKSTLLMGGESHRWFGMVRSKAGYLIITMNNSQFHREIKEAPLAAETWTVLACGVDLNTRKVAVFLNGKKAAAFDLPEDFKLVVADSKAKNREKVWTFTDYSFGGTFQGLIDECIIYGEMLSDDAMAAIPLAP